MAEVSIRNKDILATLNGFVDDFYSIDGYYNDEYRRYSSQDALDNPEYYCGEEYLQQQMSLGEKHTGFPEEHMAMPVSAAMAIAPEKFDKFRDRVKHQFAQELGAHTSALLNYYPPGGFVGWHTNWNASAYQVLFTWSKEGNGYFRYWDNQKEEIVHIQDKPGWQCRHYFFGPEDDPANHCWHAAYAGTDRITLAYKFMGVDGRGIPQHQQAQALRDLMIEDIEYNG